MTNDTVQRIIRRVMMLTWLALLLWALVPVAAVAHPLGNFTINRYSRLELQGDQILIYYIVDHAEIPALAELLRMDADGDKAISAAEEHRYLDRALQNLRGSLTVTVNGTAQPLTPLAAHLATPPGEEELPTLRLEFEFTVALPPSADGWQLHYRDNTPFVRKGGWQEIIVEPTAGVTLLSTTVPTHDVTDALRTYPDALLNTPVRVREAKVHFARAASNASVNASANATAVGLTPIPMPPPATQPDNQQIAPPATGFFTQFTNLENDRFARLITQPLDGPVTLLFLLLAAFGWGGLHALSPGHGKTIVAAYLVGARGTPRHALLLGLTTTITHTLGVFALGIITLFISAYVLPAALYPWLGVISGLLVVVVGFTLLYSRWLSWRHDQQHQHAHAHHHDDHNSDGDGHHHHTGAHGHRHVPPQQITWRNLLALGISGGLLPCPSALVVMLGAIAMGRIGLGLLLILIFSLGLATVLTVTGLLFVYAGRLFARLPRQPRLLQILPLISALIVTILGVGITVQALRQTGLLAI